MSEAPFNVLKMVRGASAIGGFDATRKIRARLIIHQAVDDVPRLLNRHSVKRATEASE